MQNALSLDALWAETPAGDRIFDGGTGFPEPVGRYLRHAIAPGARLANAVRLRMHGEIRLGKWREFEAEEVLVGSRGMIWAARTHLAAIPVTGSDQFIDGHGQMRWKALKAVPFLNASGADVSRSAAGRFASESLWLPSMLCGPRVHWKTIDDTHAMAALDPGGYAHEVTMTIAADGRLERSSMQRWGNPHGQPYGERPFGGVIEEEQAFGAYRIPSRVRVGWYLGTDRFDRDGEFFRCTIDSADFK